MQHHNIMTDHNNVIGTTSGMIFGLVTLPPTTSVISTIILGIIGAVAGFITTQLMKKIWKLFSKNERDN